MYDEGKAAIIIQFSFKKNFKSKTAKQDLFLKYVKIKNEK